MSDTTTFHNQTWRTQDTHEGDHPRRTVLTIGPESGVVYQSEAFQEVCRLLGVDHSLPTVGMTITMREGDAVVVTQTVLDKTGG